MTAYTLGFIVGTTPWFLHKDGNCGNMLRTDVPLFARTWTSELELKLWLESLPDRSRALLAGRNLFIFPLRVHVGTPAVPAYLRAALAERESVPIK